MNHPECEFDSNLATGKDEAVTCLDQQAFQALLFNSFINQQQSTHRSLDPVRRLSGILAIMRELLSRKDESEVLNLVAARALQITGATGVAIALSHEGEMICRASTGATAPDLGARFSADAGLSGECVRLGKTLVCQDTENDDRVNRQATRLLCVRSMVLVPVRHQGIIAGVLEVFASRPGAFEVEDVAALEMLSELVSLYLAYVSEHAWREALEAERGAVLQVLQQITPALETALEEEHGPERWRDNLSVPAPYLSEGSLRLSRSSLQALARSIAGNKLSPIGGDTKQ